MFSFFTKKKFLVDYLDGFTDIHNHILPGIDDGAKNVEESLGLLKGMGEFGIRDFICTPHIMENYYPNNRETIHTAMALLKNRLKLNNLNDIRIRAAAEHMIDSGFEGLVENRQYMPLDGSYILVEMSYLQASINFEGAIKKMGESTIFPILAHPERYSYLSYGKGDYAKIKNLGLLFQLNMLSLGDHYGTEVRKKGLKLLQANLIDFVASDVHNQNHIEQLKKIQLDSATLQLLQPLLEKTSYNFG